MRFSSRKMSSRDITSSHDVDSISAARFDLHAEATTSIDRAIESARRIRDIVAQCSIV
jgi:hypothetical protein